LGNTTARQIAYGSELSQVCEDELRLELSRESEGTKSYRQKQRDSDKGKPHVLPRTRKHYARTLVVCRRLDPRLCEKKRPPMGVYGGTSLHQYPFYELPLAPGSCPRGLGSRSTEASAAGRLIVATSASRESLAAAM
jgi:hypothetical protein